MNKEKDRQYDCTTEKVRMEKISVIVPIYNAEKYLNDCLETITGQTYSNLEILLIDDGSKDNSADLCRKWCTKDSRIRLLQQENQGVSAARNLGLDQAGGAYIAFVDADDWIQRDMLERQLDCLTRENSDMVLCGFQEVVEKDREKIRNLGDDSQDCENRREKTENFKNLQEPEHQGCTQTYCTVNAETYAAQYLFRGNTRCWSVLFSRETIGNIRFRTGLTIGEDMLFLADLLDRVNRVSVMKEQLYCYYQNSSGAMFSAFKASYMDQITCWQLVREQMAPKRPEVLGQIDVCLFQAILLTVGKLATGKGEAGYLMECHKAAIQCWKNLGIPGRHDLPTGYQIKGPIFLAAPRVYLKLYHLWKGSN